MAEIAEYEDVIIAGELLETAPQKSRIEFLGFLGKREAYDPGKNTMSDFWMALRDGKVPRQSFEGAIVFYHSEGIKVYEDKKGKEAAGYFKGRLGSAYINGVPEAVRTKIEGLEKKMGELKKGGEDDKKNFEDIGRLWSAVIGIRDIERSLRAQYTQQTQTRQERREEEPSTPEEEIPRLEPAEPGE